MKADSLKTILDQIILLARANMSERYRKTLAGFIWVVINPIILFAAQSIVFKYFLQINIKNYFIFMLGGLIPWTFLSSTLSMGTPILYNSRELLKAFKINPFVIVAAQIFDNGINFLFSFFVLFIPMIFLSKISFTGLIFFPLAFILAIIALSALVWTLSVLHVFFRDTSFVVGFVLNIMFFLTPIFYSEEFIPIQYRWMLNLNIFYMIIEPFRLAIYDFNLKEILISLSKCAGLSIVLTGFAFNIWRKKKNDFYTQL